MNDPFMQLHRGETVYTDTFAYKAINGEIRFCDYTWDWHWSKLYGGFSKVASTKNFYSVPQVAEDKKHAITGLLARNIVSDFHPLSMQ